MVVVDLVSYRRQHWPAGDRAEQVFSGGAELAWLGASGDTSWRYAGRVVLGRAAVGHRVPLRDPDVVLVRQTRNRLEQADRPIRVGPGTLGAHRLRRPTRYECRRATVRTSCQHRRCRA
jgi:hypothetical protein